MIAMIIVSITAPVLAEQEIDQLGCDAAMQKSDRGTQMDVNAAWYDNHQCWKRNMNKALNKRLLQLKKTDFVEFHQEMQLQMKFNQATEAMCSRGCGESGSLSGTPKYYCEIEAYKFRTAQAIQINQHQLTVPMEQGFLRGKSGREKEKFTHGYKDFISAFCKLPENVWKNKLSQSECEAKAYNELNNLEFTDDVCDLS